MPKEKVLAALTKAKHVVFVEGNYTGQFSRLVRAETGFHTESHLRKFDGEPFWPEDIVAKVKAILDGETGISRPPNSMTPADAPEATLQPLGAI